MGRPLLRERLSTFSHIRGIKHGTKEHSLKIQSGFQRQLNNFGFRKYAEAGKGTCVYVRDDLSGLPAEALLDLRRKAPTAEDGGAEWSALDPGALMAARLSAAGPGGVVANMCAAAPPRALPPPRLSRA